MTDARLALGSTPAGRIVADSKTAVARAKSKLSKQLLDEPGIVGVGIRGSSVVVYLERDEPALRDRVQDVARRLRVSAPIVFEATGTLRKH